MPLNNDHQSEINLVRSETFQTRRVISPDLEETLYEPIRVLDHGFVRPIDYMGNDAAIVQAARVSYGAGTKKISEDQGLINYLMRHRHTTPFEMCEIKFHVKMPIFIARQWLRHRTANVNEYSARYSILKDEFYSPPLEYLAPQSKQNNQGRAGELTLQEKKVILDILRKDAQQSYRNYEKLMNVSWNGETIDENKPGLARELARMNLNLSFYTEFYWKIDLHNLFHFLSLRADKHAQLEIRDYAEVIMDITKRWVPYAYEAFVQYRQKGAYVSQKGKEVLKKIMNGQEVTAQSSGLSTREWQELLNEFNIQENQIKKDKIA
jgi:thymidylate synthase (FAD)